MGNDHRISSYQEFWPFYLHEHSKRSTRTWHFAGTGVVILISSVAALSRKPKLLLAAPVAGYGPAWFAHFFIENNRPATFKYPLWSLVSDFRMFFLWLSGKLDAELVRHQIEPKAD
eukprot:jgi/Botrbrau1/1466/Bobra.178_3s0023.1